MRLYRWRLPLASSLGHPFQTQIAALVVGDQEKVVTPSDLASQQRLTEAVFHLVAHKLPQRTGTLDEELPLTATEQVIACGWADLQVDAELGQPLAASAQQLINTLG